MAGAETAARQSLAKRLERVEEAIARTEALKEGSRTPSDISSGSTPHGLDQTIRQNSVVTNHGCPVCRSKSSVQLPSSRSANAPLGQIYFAGQNFGAICSRNGVPHFTSSGEQWIYSQTGQWPRFEDIYGTDLAGPGGAAAASTLYSLSNRSQQGSEAQLPPKWVVQSLLDEFLASDFSLVFPLIDRVMFDETLKLAYSRQKQPLLCEFVGAKACVFAFVSMASSRFTELEAASYIDPDACAKEAQVLLADFLEDASVTTLQTIFMLAAIMYHAVACRTVFALGAHTTTVSRSTGRALTPAEREDRHVRHLFWLCYSFDKDIALRTGQPPIIRDDFCDMTLPDGYVQDRYDRHRCGSDSKAPWFPNDLRLSLIKSKAVDAIYSNVALRKSDAELLRTIREMDDELERWRVSIPAEFSPALSVRRAVQLDDLDKSRSMLHIELHLDYHYLLNIIHCASGRCVFNQEGPDKDKTYGVESSLDLAMEASRSTLVYLSAMAPRLASETFWLDFLSRLPMASENAVHDVELLSTASDVIRSMPLHRETAYETAYLRRMDCFVAELSRLGKALYLNHLVRIKVVGLLPPVPPLVRHDTLPRRSSTAVAAVSVAMVVVVVVVDLIYKVAVKVRMTKRPRRDGVAAPARLVAQVRHKGALHAARVLEVLRVVGARVARRAVVREDEDSALSSTLLVLLRLLLWTPLLDLLLPPLPTLLLTLLLALFLRLRTGEVGRRGGGGGGVGDACGEGESADFIVEPGEVTHDGMEAKSETNNAAVDSCSGVMCEKSVHPSTVTSSERSNRRRSMNTNCPVVPLPWPLLASARLVSSFARSKRRIASSASFTVIDIVISTSTSTSNVIEAVRLMVAEDIEDDGKLAQLALEERVQPRVVRVAHVPEEREVRRARRDGEVAVHGQVARRLEVQVRHDLDAGRHTRARRRRVLESRTLVMRRAGHDECSILARKGIPSAVWFEDALFFYGSDTAVFDLYMLVPDVGAASAILQSDGFRETGVGSLFPNDERASRASGGVRLKRVGADEDADGTVLLGAADWKFDLRNTELSSPAPVPQLSSFLESIMERWLSMSGEVCDEHYLWFLSLANLIGYAYTLQGPNRELVRRPEYAEQLQPRFRELHYDMVAEYPKKSGILSYGKHEYHVIRYREIQEGKFTPRPYPSGNFPPSLAEYPRLTGLDASTPTPRRKRRSPANSQSPNLAASQSLDITPDTMAPKYEAVHTTGAPQPLPQFSQAVKYNGMVYLSGNIGAIPGKAFELVQGTVKDRARQAIRNIAAILEASGSRLENIVKLNIYITTMKDFALVNEAYDEFFTWDPKPARTCVAVHELPLGTDVEIECTAHLDQAARL
ncbi:fungal specific transcription factor domain-containing protein [Purpureocillium lavendulum]|uniref:Fungal specific transcription factor domain-containing protein n=1 Tax=Purpureocillium lavendulum TaxID=1247861 RepID=A0AB34G2N8_9HYPO|nr:fungal specific transcription factor domain-containing protein [Purpureocillium lavendulum]